MRIKIAGTEFSIVRKSFEIYVQGCYRGCPGCHNPETQPFENGKSVDINEFLNAQKERTDLFPDLVQNIYISGGDLLCQSGNIPKEFSKKVKELWPDKFKWLFTGCDYDKIPNWAWDYYDIIKAGPYIPTLKQEGKFPASSNQELIFNCKLLGKDIMLKKSNVTEFVGLKRWYDDRS